ISSINIADCSLETGCSYNGDFVVDDCGADALSGLDFDRTPGIDPDTGCVTQTLHYVDDTTSTTAPVTFYDFAGNPSDTIGGATVHFEKGTPDDAVLYGACDGVVSPCSNLTTLEGGTVSLKGYVDAPSNDHSSLSIDWGDGSPPTNASYPCFPTDVACPF